MNFLTVKEPMDLIILRFYVLCNGSGNRPLLPKNREMERGKEEARGVS